MLAMHPELDEGLSRDRLALGDFIFVVRENVVDGAAMNVERFAKLLHRHRRTLDVPARASQAEWRLAVRLVFVGVDSRADFQFAFVQPRQPSVVREARYAVIDRITLLIRIAALDQSRD